MKRLLILAFLFALSALPAQATIAFSHFGSGNSNGSTAQTINATVTINAGDTVVVFASTATTSNAVNSIAGGGTYAKCATIANNAGTTTLEIWSTAAGAATSNTSIAVTWSSSSATAKNVVVLTYTGVVALGNTATSAPTSTSTNPTISLTTQDANNFVVAGSAVGAARTFTAQTGNLRAQSSQTGQANWGGDNTAASASSVTVSVTYNLTAGSNAIAALELRSIITATVAPGLMLRGVGE